MHKLLQEEILCKSADSTIKGICFYFFYSINPTQDPIVVVAGQGRTAVLDRCVGFFCVLCFFWNILPGISGREPFQIVLRPFTHYT